MSQVVQSSAHSVQSEVFDSHNLDEWTWSRIICCLGNDIVSIAHFRETCTHLLKIATPMFKSIQTKQSAMAQIGAIIRAGYLPNASLYARVYDTLMQSWILLNRDDTKCNRLRQIFNVLVCIDTSSHRYEPASRDYLIARFFGVFVTHYTSWIPIDLFCKTILSASDSDHCAYDICSLMRHIELHSILDMLPQSHSSLKVVSQIVDQCSRSLSYSSFELVRMSSLLIIMESFAEHQDINLLLHKLEKRDNQLCTSCPHSSMPQYCSIVKKLYAPELNERTRARLFAIVPDRFDVTSRIIYYYIMNLARELHKTCLCVRRNDDVKLDEIRKTIQFGWSNIDLPFLMELRETCFYARFMLPYLRTHCPCVFNNKTGQNSQIARIVLNDIYEYTRELSRNESHTYFDESYRAVYVMIMYGEYDLARKMSDLIAPSRGGGTHVASDDEPPREYTFVDCMNDARDGRLNYESVCHDRAALKIITTHASMFKDLLYDMYMFLEFTGMLDINPLLHQIDSIYSEYKIRETRNPYRHMCIRPHYW